MYYKLYGVYDVEAYIYKFKFIKWILKCLDINDLKDKKKELIETFDSKLLLVSTCKAIRKVYKDKYLWLIVEECSNALDRNWVVCSVKIDLNKDKLENEKDLENLIEQKLQQDKLKAEKERDTLETIESVLNFFSPDTKPKREYYKDIYGNWHWR